MEAFQNRQQCPVTSDPDPLRVFITGHLNRIYLVQSHMTERLQELLDQPCFSGLRDALEETLRTVEQQLARLYGIYLLLDGVPAIRGCDELTDLLEGAYTTIHGQFAGKVFRDLAVFFYVQTAESAVMVCYKRLQLAVEKAGHQRLRALLEELCSGAAANEVLVSAIMENHWS